MNRIEILIVVIVGILFVSRSWAQSDGASRQRLRNTPQKELFKSEDGLVGSWQGCFKMPDERHEHGCYKKSYAKEFQSAQNFTLFNADGTVWLHASRLENAEYRQSGLQYFGDSKKEFEPFSSNGRDIVLRLTAESPSWFEVEVNETTRETKFVHKTDPAWAKTNWEFWSKIEGTIVIPDDQRLRRTPNGEVLERTKDRILGDVRLVRTDGDWAHVETIEVPLSSAEQFRGWIRWKRGRAIMIGCFLNQRRVPALINGKNI